MKLLKTNPITNQIITKNGNSKEMPAFLTASQPRFFQFNQVTMSETKKKLFPIKNYSSIQITDQIRGFKSSYAPSIKNISTIKSLLTDEIIPQQKSQKKTYTNNIFNYKKQYQLEPQYIQEHKHKMPEAYKGHIENENTFKKPYQFAKLVDQFSNTQIINRKPQSSTIQISVPTQQRNKSLTKQSATDMSIMSKGTLTHRFKSVYKQKPYEIDTVKRMTFHNTIQKHKKLYDHLVKQQKKQDQQRIMVTNAISNMIVGDNILEILQKNRRKFKK